MTDIEIDSIEIDVDKIEVKDNGYAGYNLQYRSNADVESYDGYETYESFPFSFWIELDYDIAIQETLEIAIDTSSFSE